MGLTLVEKIAARHADGLAPGTQVRSGDFVSIRPRHVMTHDNTGAVIPKFKQIGATSIADPAQPVFAIDHDIQNTSPENLAKYAKIEAFAREHGIDFYPAGTGISHQVMVEQGYVVPGSMVVASDSHSNLYGAMAALGTPVVRTDAASIWATGVTWWQVPPVAKVVLKGKLSPGVVGKDVIIALCGLFNKDEVLNHAVEFVGDGAANLPMSARMTIANMTTEWGALAGVFPFDEITVNYLRSRVPEFTNPKRPGTRGAKSRSGYTNADIEKWWKNRSELSADPDAEYAIELELDLATVVPHVSGPNEVKTMVSLPEMERKHVPIQKAYLLSCVNARFEDLRDAAEVIRTRGGRVADGVEFYLAPASAETQARAESSGDWQTLIGAGAIPLPPGCGACIGLGRGLVQKGETAISATNRNFKGRMGLTLVEKIAARHADGLAPGTQVRTGDFITIRPKHVMTHDNTGAVIPKFKQIGATWIHDPRQPVFAIDHDIQNPSRRRTSENTRRSPPSPGSTTSTSPGRHGHRPPDHGRTGLCRARLDGRRLRLAFEPVRGPAARGHRSRAPTRPASGRPA